MDLQGRTLEPNVHGDDVALLHRELRLLGFTIGDREGLFGSTTFVAVQQFQRDHGIEPTNGIVDARTARAINAALAALPRDGWVVRGSVLQVDGSPVPNATAEVLERRVRSERSLGRDVSDRQGAFEVGYPPPEGASPSLLVRAASEDGRELAVSDLICDAGPVEEVTLVVGNEALRGPSEYARLERVLRQALAAEQLDPAELDADDLEFLVCRFELNRDHVAYFIVSARLHRETDVAPPWFYGLVRQGLPLQLPALLAQDPRVLRETLTAALARNLIPAELANGLDEALDRLQELIVRHAFRPSAIEGTFSLGELFATTRLSREQQSVLLRRYIQREGSVEEFWRDLEEDPDFGRERVREAQFALQLATLTSNHLPLVETLRDEGVASTRALARFTREDWLERIRGGRPGGGVVGTPPSIPGDDDEERQETYATVLAAIVEDAFPTAVLAARLAADDGDGITGRDDLLTFFERNPDFDLTRTKVRDYLREHPDAAFDGVADEALLRRNLQSFRRLAAVAPRHGRYEVVQPLLGAGLASAHAIARRPATSLALLQDAVGEAQAHAVVNRASHRSAAAQTLFAEFSPAMHRALPKAIFPGIQPGSGTPAGLGNWYDSLPAEPGVPDWEALFGNVDFCACEHCRSVLSPAAYLVDILAFANDQGLDDAFLFPSRRGDIIDLELNCANTNTSLPYIDLVNELLEGVVAGDPEPHQTTWNAEELRAQAEHRNDEAYEVLAGAVFPWSLPFSLPHEEAWRYLEHLGVRRHLLMEAFRSDTGGPSAAAIAADQLRLTRVDRAIIVGDLNLGAPLPELWGMPNATLNELRADLRSVPTFLAQAGLEYTELLERLSLRFIDPTGNQGVEFDDIAVCDLATAVFSQPLSETFLDRFHRFERLRRKLGWSGYDLDRAITALAPNGELADTFLIRLATLARLEERLPVARTEMLGWWAPIDTRTYTPDGLDPNPSLYAERFQDRIAFDRDTLAVFTLNASGTELADPGQDLETHLPSVGAALGLTAEDVIAVTGGAPTDLDLASISLLFRHATLARALGMPVRDLAALRALSGVDPFDDPSETTRFLSVVDRLQNAEIDVPLLLFLLRHDSRPNDREFLLHGTIGGALERVRSGLQAIRDETTLPDDLRALIDEADPAPEPASGGPLEAYAAQQLGKLLEGDALDVAMALIGGFPPDDPEGFVSEHLPFLDADEALSRLVGQDGDPAELDPDSERAQRFAYVLEPLLVHLRRELGEAFVVQSFAAELDVPVAAAQQLLLSTLDPLLDEAQRMVEDVLNDAFVLSHDDLTTDATAAGEPTAETYAVQFQSFTRLWKAAALVGALDLTPNDIAWLDRHGTTLDLLDVNELPLVPPTGANLLPDRFPALLRLLELNALRDSLPAGDPTLHEQLELAIDFDPATADAAAAEAAFLDRLHDRTGWDRDDLAFLASPEALDFAYPDAYRDGHAVRRLQAAVERLRRLGVSASEVVPAWIGEDVTADAAQRIKATAKAKFDSRPWLAVAQAINDGLRERQRDALLAHLITDRGNAFGGTAEIYDHLLIDPEMSACMLTSRIKQAISAVQLLVQRVQLNLEEDASLSPEAIETWNGWMKQYRVWEANRLVFLYPENWVEPELRDDKTPIFLALENELMQNAISERTVETAFRHYLETLQELSQLEIAGIYNETGRDLHHVFARTPDTPHTYYYRRWHFPKFWTPWAKVDLDIEGDHLIPVVLEDRLFLFWPIFVDKPVDRPPPAANDATKPEIYIEVSLAWSEYRDGSWSAKTVSEETFVIPEFLISDSADVARALSHFRTDTTGSSVAIAHFFGGGTSTSEIGRFHFSLASRRVSAVQLIESLDDFAADLAPDPMPQQTAHEFMKFSEMTTFFGFPLESAPLEIATSASGARSRLLSRTPGRFKVAYPQQHRKFHSQSTFFYEDARKTFAVYPFDLRSGGSGPLDPDFTAGIRTTHDATPDAVDRIVPLVATMVLDDGDEFDGSDLGAIPDDPPFDALDPTSAGTEEPNVLALADLAEMTIFPAYHGDLEKRFRFYGFYHPYARAFLSLLNRWGVGGLLGTRGAPNASFLGGSASFFADRYGDPPPAVLPPYPVEDVAFQRSDAYATYNWELFFHAPLLIADRLRQDQRFEVALRWLHTIFDPTDCAVGDPPGCYWKLRPFNEYDLGSLSAKPIQELLKILSQGSVVYDNQVAEWRENPFNPHAIARLRTIAYQKTVVMKYLDTLIGWADQLFRRDSIESINEATQLYVLAAEILGQRPTAIPMRDSPPVQTFRSLEPMLDDFSNALIEIENDQAFSTMEAAAPGGSPPPIGTTFYFCIPENAKLLGYWDTVEDRLFKIRHCMNIEGVVRELPLFEPPIDPGLLVAAAAAGVDIGSAIGDLSAPPPRYRFSVLAQKAGALAGEVGRLGNAFLNALEKRDAEELALLRATLEVEILMAAEGIKRDQFDEVVESRQALVKTKDLVTLRKEHYTKLLNASAVVTVDDIDIGEALDLEGLGLLKEELLQLGHTWEAAELGTLATAPQLYAAITSLIPSFTFGVAGAFGSPLTSVGFGGGNFSGAASSASSVLQQLASVRDRYASMVGTIASHKRRADEWSHQQGLASAEIARIDKEIDAADVRVAIAQKEIQHHAKRIEQAKRLEDLVAAKYTSQELYGWLVSQLATVFFQSYQLAYDLAKRAERAFRHELGVADTDFIRFGYWDNLKKGLLSGDKLLHDLHRMEAAYLEQNKRELEITKHVSLAQLDPVALLQLREEGSCEVEIPEVLFDLDFPGHYLRRIKTVGLTIPCVTGPYTGVSCTLTLLRHGVRTAPSTSEPLHDTFGAVESIATSSAQNDSGLFQLDFRDERYLPFERAGAVGRWRLELPRQFPQFDYDTISDVVFHIGYTARDGGAAFRSTVEAELQERLETRISAGEMEGLLQLFSAKHDFPNEWHRFLHPPEAAEGQTLHLNLEPRRFPHMFRDRNIEIEEVFVFLKPEEGRDFGSAELAFTLEPDGGAALPGTLRVPGISNLPDLPGASVVSGGPPLEPMAWRIDVAEDAVGALPDDLVLAVEADGATHPRLDPAAFDDMLLVCRYRVTGG